MVIVIGSIVAQRGKAEEVLALSQQHVRRSRLEPGCISHAVHVDAEDPQRLVFIERWQDEVALAAHFKVPASTDFVTRLRALVSEEPVMDVYAATALP